MKLNNKNRRQSKASLHMYLDIGRHERSKSLTTLGPYGQFFYSIEIIYCFKGTDKDKLPLPKVVKPKILKRISFK